MTIKAGQFFFFFFFFFFGGGGGRGGRGGGGGGWLFKLIIKQEIYLVTGDWNQSRYSFAKRFKGDC